MMKNSLLQRWFKGQKPSASSVTLNSERFKNITVLIVDDSRTQLYAMEKMLQSTGIETLTAENGKQGILMARHKQPDVVLMDIVMPEINGFQATRYLTRQPDTRHIPIVIISGSDQMSDKAWGLKLGARDYLSKPVDKKQLLLTITRVLDEVAMQVPEPEPVAATAQAL